ncbi:MAG TPA: carboxypeptidase-like regulatory domain-containing protein, partial [Gemmatimonadaceae bacterium]|nr:carboxypeptidase-like regulatory domain-containing protein [Gemmatimonadaceae bacterium]
MRVKSVGQTLSTILTLATLIVIASFIPPSEAAAQQLAVIEGTVVVSPSGAPVAEATVMIEGTGRGAITDESGRYRIAGVPAGQHALIAQRIGHKKERKVITIDAAIANRVDFELSEAAAIVPPVVVSMTREMQRRADA